MSIVNDIANVAWGDLDELGVSAKPVVASAPAIAESVASAPSISVDRHSADGAARSGSTAAAAEPASGHQHARPTSSLFVRVSFPLYDSKAVLRKLGVSPAHPRPTLTTFYEDLVGNFLFDRGCSPLEVHLQAGHGQDGLSGKAVVRMYDAASVAKALALQGTPIGEADLGSTVPVAVEVQQQAGPHSSGGAAASSAPRSFLQAVAAAGSTAGGSSSAAAAQSAPRSSAAKSASGASDRPAVATSGKPGQGSSGQRKPREGQPTSKDDGSSSKDDGRWAAFGATMSKGGSKEGAGASGKAGQEGALEGGDGVAAIERRKLAQPKARAEEGSSGVVEAPADGAADGGEEAQARRAAGKPRAAASGKPSGDKPKGGDSSKPNLYSALMDDEDDE